MSKNSSSKTPDDKPFDICDRTFASGRIGLWTKSDAVTYFDDLRLEILK